MAISQKGLYAPQAMRGLTRPYGQGTPMIPEVVHEGILPEKFLEKILRRPGKP